MYFLQTAVLVLYTLAFVLNPHPALCTSELTYRLRRLNRILEQRQVHEYESGRSYRILEQHNYNIRNTRVIAGHFRQLRTLKHHLPDDLFLLPFYHQEKARMDRFVDDVDELNALTDNRLYRRHGHVKDCTFDDLSIFIQREIRRLR